MTDDYTSSTSTTGYVAVGGSATGEIERGGDRDWFAVTLEAGKTYRFDLEGSSTDEGTLSDPYLRGIHDADGNWITGTWNDDGGAGYNSRVTFTATEDATYYVSAGGVNSYVEGTYTLSVTDVTDEITASDDFTAGTDTAGTVTVGGSATGEIEFGGDRDWFAVTLEAGKTYRFDLEGSGTDAGSLSNPYLRGIHDADGDLIAGTTNNNGGARYNSRVGFTATEDATYYVSAGAHQSRTGTYTLSVTEATDDFTAGTGSATGDRRRGDPGRYRTSSATGDPTSSWGATATGSRWQPGGGQDLPVRPRGLGHGGYAGTLFDPYLRWNPRCGRRPDRRHAGTEQPWTVPARTAG